MNPYELPISVNVCGKDLRIRTDYRDILTILISQNDPELCSNDKMAVMLQIFYEDSDLLTPEMIPEAVDKAVEFIDCGQEDDGGNHPRLIDWEQDAGMIIPAVNRITNQEIRSVPYMHWWTFWGAYLEIGDCLLSSVIGIRAKKAKGKQLEKYEREFYRENKKLIDLQARLTDDEKRQKAALEKWLD